MSPFDVCVGIDYSGSSTSVKRTPAIQVYSSTNPDSSQAVACPQATNTRRRNWCRSEVAEWIVETILSGQRIIAGVDHGFSFPESYFEREQLTSWHQFLDHICDHWPTNDPNVTVDSIRNSEPRPPVLGSGNEYRLTERWTTSAKSVFLFDVQGSVAKSTIAGLPWLRHIRREVGKLVHFWPFDGWSIPNGKSVLAETFPSLFRRRFPVEGRTADQQDAYSVARWLSRVQHDGSLAEYLNPPLDERETEIAQLEGWILGVR